MTCISFKNVSFSYGNSEDKAIDGVKLDIEEGEFVALLGANGSGKSTLSKLANGLLLPSEGEVEVFGMKTSEKKNIFDIRKSVGVVFQNPDNQLVASIVEDDVAFGPENIGLPREEIGKRIEFALKAVGMEKFRKSTPERLSGGQKQRVAIAGALALKPKILILDESTAMLDPKGRREVIEIAKKLNKEEKITVILITHYMEETTEADRIIVLSHGRIAEEGKPREVFYSDKINESGLEKPLAAFIAEKLKNAGVPIKDGILTEEELAEELCVSLRKI